MVCLFILLKVSFEGTFLILMTLNLSMFSFVDRSYLSNLCLSQGHKDSPMFSSRGIIILTFTFRSPVHFNIDICQDSSFIIIIIICVGLSYWFSTIYWKDNAFPIELSHHLCKKRNWSFWVYFWTLCCSIHLCFFLCHLWNQWMEI